MYVEKCQELGRPHILLIAEGKVESKAMCELNKEATSNEFVPENVKYVSIPTFTDIENNAPDAELTKKDRVFFENVLVKGSHEVVDMPGYIRLFGYADKRDSTIVQSYYVLFKIKGARADYLYKDIVNVDFGDLGIV